MKHQEQPMRTTSTRILSRPTGLAGLAVLACLGACASTAPQSFGDGSVGIGPQYMRGAFERSAPEIGEPMPDLIVYDEAGTELRLREVLSGRHTVLILGCLT